MNHYSTSTGERVPKSIIDRRVTEAKRQKIEQMLDQHGYIFCEECRINASCGIPLDCSHDISVDEAQKTGQSELAWSISNITIRCRLCHQKHDHTKSQTIKSQENEISRERLRTGRNSIPVARKFRIA